MVYDGKSETGSNSILKKHDTTFECIKMIKMTKEKGKRYEYLE